MIEIESKFTIPEEFSNTLLKDFKVDFLQGYQLSNIKRKSILDIYFDFEDSKLDKLNCSLRVRYVNNEKVLLTLKAPKSINGPVHEREELEGPLNMNKLKGIIEKLKEIADEQIDYSPELIDLTYWGVNKVFKQIGLIEQFQLLNNRIIRDVFIEGEEIGEINLDNVVYQINHQTSKLYELEIEINNGENEKDLQNISQYLQEKYPFLHNSTKSKYQRGIELKSTQEYHKLEAKIIIPQKATADKVYRFLRDYDSLIEFELGSPSQYDITDKYLDFSNNIMYSNNAYLRIRRVEGKLDELTFRDFRFSDQDQIIDGKQIKGPATFRKLSEVLEYLVSKKVINKNTLRIQEQNLSFDDILRKLNLNCLIKTRIHRYVFPIFERSNHIVSLKLDYVEFLKEDNNKKYYEIELSAENDSDQSKKHLTLMALYLANKFSLSMTNNPKIYIGMALMNEESLQNMIGKKSIPILHTRVNLSYQHLIDFRRKNDEEKERIYNESIKGYRELVKSICHNLNIEFQENSNLVDTNARVISALQEVTQSNENSSKRMKKDWYEKIGKGKVKDVLEEMLDFFTKYEVDDKIKEIIQIQFRFNSIETSKIHGTNDPEGSKELNKVINSIIELISKV